MKRTSQNLIIALALTATTAALTGCSEVPQQGALKTQADEAMHEISSNASSRENPANDSVMLTFATKEDCIAQGGYTPEQAEIIFAQAQKDYEENAPVYTTAAECEAAHGDAIARQLICGGSTASWDEKTDDKNEDKKNGNAYTYYSPTFRGAAFPYNGSNNSIVNDYWMTRAMFSQSGSSAMTTSGIADLKPNQVYTAPKSVIQGPASRNIAKISAASSSSIVSSRSFTATRGSFGAVGRASSFSAGG